MTTGSAQRNAPIGSRRASRNTKSHRAHARNATSQTAPAASGSTADRSVVSADSKKSS